MVTGMKFFIRFYNFLYNIIWHYECDSKVLVKAAKQGKAVFRREGRIETMTIDKKIIIIESSRYRRIKN